MKKPYLGIWLVGLIYLVGIPLLNWWLLKNGAPTQVWLFCTMLEWCSP